MVDEYITKEQFDYTANQLDDTIATFKSKIDSYETEIDQFRSTIAGLVQQNVDLATKIELLIQNLEKALNVDVNVDGTIQQ